MKRKILILLFTLSFLILGVNSVNARECEYTYKGNKIKITTTEVASETDPNKKSFIVEEDFYLENDKYDGKYNFLDGALIENNEQCWKSLNVCELTVRDLPAFTNLTNALSMNIFGYITIIANETSKEKYIGVFGSSLDSLTMDDAYANEFDALDPAWWENSFWSGRGVTCSTAEYSGPDMDQKNFISFCDRFVELYSNIANSYKEYQTCETSITGTDNASKKELASCKSKALSKVNKHTDVLKNTCDNILQNQNLDVNDGCISSCLMANKSIQKLKEDYIGIENFSDTECGFSSRLLVWLSNIMRWIKYILPIGVIVLGILDFIKAIGSDKEDEMKKAQGRFVKRLIAAALVFIIPFVIEFVLDKMGFGYNECGLF